MILQHCHSSSYGGHFGGSKTTTKRYFNMAFIGLFCSRVQKSLSCIMIVAKEPTISPVDMRCCILEVELEDVRGINFMG